MEEIHFTKQEALSKIGKNIKIINDYAGMPKNTLGTVLSTKNEEGCWTVVIRWWRPTGVLTSYYDNNNSIWNDILVDKITKKPLIDWFVKSEYEQFFRELSQFEAC